MAYTTIDDPSAYFQTALWTGNGSTQSITNDGNLDLQPDWIWTKRRDGDGQNHHAIDSSRGASKALVVNDTDAEATKSNGITAFNSDGFSVGTDTNFNNNTTTYVAWQWKANGGTTSTDTNGSQDSTVQVNSTAGFSIVKRTGTGSAGATYGHGLGAVPDVIINKGLNSNEWYSYFKAIGGGTHWMNLDGTNAAIDDANMWHDTDATSTVFTVGNSGGSNGSGVEYIAYCFTEIQGYSKFGKYVGNGTSSSADFDGPFVYTGFEPAWIMTKRSSASNGSWAIVDNKRDTTNPTQIALFANTSGTDDTDKKVDFLSNGFKLRNSRDDFNTDGVTYVYMAFAEHPFVSSEGVPVTAK